MNYYGGGNMKPANRTLKKWRKDNPKKHRSYAEKRNRKEKLLAMYDLIQDIDSGKVKDTTVSDVFKDFYTGDKK